MLLVGAAVYVAVSATGTPAARYRTVAARLGNVSQAITVSGTLQPVSQFGVDFGSAGVVASVTVKPGQDVVAGQVLARLATTTH
ncbi:MAG: hypothetical protein ACYDHU_08470, partial [Acidimicrobiales bacterium]